MYSNKNLENATRGFSVVWQTYSGLSFQNFNQNPEKYGDKEYHHVKVIEVGEWQLRVIYGSISRFDFDASNNIRLSTKVTKCHNVSACEVDTMIGADCVCNEAVVVYLAVCG
ncbi:uncharacterized protein BDV17DRAFT_252103 [Aspergillus undulatus]|uniref:uncharacterized protein n=1 Tax=Aspergillus undulatus TaxID=1810928 RepID=UPI003CCCAE07